MSKRVSFPKCGLALLAKAMSGMMDLPPCAEKILRLSAHSRASESHVEDNRIPELVVDRVPSVCRSVVAEAEAVFVHVPSRASHGEGQWQSEASCRRCSVDFVCRAEMIVWECREHLAGEAVRIVERKSAGISSVEPGCSLSQLQFSELVEFVADPALGLAPR